MKHLFALALVAAVLRTDVACPSAQAARSLVGSWRLVSWESRDSGGGISYPMGRDAIGQVIFDPAGQVSLQLMQRNRPAFASGDRALGTPPEFEAAFVGFLSYFGRYTFDVRNGTLTMEIEGASFPNLVGTKQIRHIEIAEPRFTGTTPPVMVGGKRVTGVFVWERVR